MGKGEAGGDLLGRHVTRQTPNGGPPLPGPRRESLELRYRHGDSRPRPLAAIMRRWLVCAAAILALCALEPPVATAARLLCELGGPCTGDDRRGKLGGLIVFLKGVIRTFLSLDESSVA
ncbi:uncharacterized protein LOC134530858 isoform X3 [Bacillus rossius redtenbacheri]|uniref:uncharacterized protein LOC134530858 isoform X3 n=1 Tax=Bacillus rossius redtenbacheri TaxID=93214 RepID=UPI002FDEACEE